MSKITEETGDLFELDDSWALAHCVGSDFIMGKGIATEFEKRYSNRDWLLAQKKKVGETVLMRNTMAEKNVFYMITKEFSKKSKPTYNDIEKCLADMFKQAGERGLKKIGMPKIGCGLDGKDWSEVKKLIQKHQPTDTEIIVRIK